MTVVGVGASSLHSGDIGRSFHRQLLRIYVLATSVFTMLGALFFITGLDFSAEQRNLVLGVIAPLSSIPQILADVWLINRHVKPIRSFFESLTTPDVAVRAKRALSRVMSLPRLTAGRILFVHAPVIAVALTVNSLIANRYWGLGLARWQFLMVYLVVFMFASGHTIYEYFAVKRACRNVLPHLLIHIDEADRDAITSARRLGMRAQLLFVFAFSACVPLVALGAVRAAIGVREALIVFNASEQAQGCQPLRVGTGIHVGEVIAGSVGSPDRMEYTVIGDVVNVAARLQALTKDLGVDVLLSRDVHEKVKAFVPARALPPVPIRGKSEQLEVYAIDEPTQT
jgi:class 3 adenylate cyclase